MERLTAYKAVGCDELFFCMTAPVPAQVDRLAELVLA